MAENGGKIDVQTLIQKDKFAKKFNISHTVISKYQYFTYIVLGFNKYKTGTAAIAISVIFLPVTLCYLFQ